MLYSTRHPMVKGKMQQPVEILWTDSQNALYHFSSSHGFRTPRIGQGPVLRSTGSVFQMGATPLMKWPVSVVLYGSDRRAQCGIRPTPLYSNVPNIKLLLTQLLRFFFYKNSLINYIAHCA